MLLCEACGIPEEEEQRGIPTSLDEEILRTVSAAPIDPRHRGTALTSDSAHTTDEWPQGPKRVKHCLIVLRTSQPKSIHLVPYTC